ncbi:MAG: glycosyl transferase [Cyanobacteria bacterium QS_8_64_29]|nr:MAG: glycosyl transferase [Cyanobacteria bacterium QS_8_64_29]
MLAVASEAVAGAAAWGLLLLQLPAAAILLSRLLAGVRRAPPIAPVTAASALSGAASAIVPTRNEAQRLPPCLQGLSRQGPELREAIVVDSHSQDGTPELVRAAQSRDPRLQLVDEGQLPIGWIGRPWALQVGFGASSPHSDWIVGIDADTQPQPGAIAGAIATAQAYDCDVLSLSPRFILQTPGEWWLQPALLVALLYRCDLDGRPPQRPERAMANGQCLLARRSVLAQLGGYSSAAASFCDDVTLARNAAARGFRVGFFDGRRVLKVRMYEGARETWHEWGRSLDLQDACSRAQLWADVGLLLGVQGLPLPVMVLVLTAVAVGLAPLPVLAVAGLNGGLLAVRLGLLAAIAPCYEWATGGRWPGWPFWLSPLADPLAVLRVGLSAATRPTQWRGRIYSAP